MRKKIFHIIGSLDVGGTEQQLLLLVPRLQPTYDTEVVCLLNEGPIGRSLQQSGIPVHYLNGTSRYDFRVLPRLWRILRQHQPHVVITYLILADILGRIASRLAGIPIIITSHRSHLFGPLWWHMLDRLTRVLVTHYTVQTATAKKDVLERLNNSPSKITVIPNAVQLAKPKYPAEHLRKTLHIAPSAITIVCIANLKPQKQHDLLLEAFERIHQQFPNTVLLLVGEGPLRSTITNHISRLQSKSNIQLLGHRSDIADILHSSDIFVLPSETEGMSNAILEAMQAGLPCIAADIPTNREIIIHKETGRLFTTNDISSLTQELMLLIKQPKQRHALGQAAQAYTLRHHSTPHVVNQWKTLIESLTT